MNWFTVILECVAFALLMCTISDVVISSKLKKLGHPQENGRENDILPVICIVIQAVVVTLNILFNLNLKAMHNKTELMGMVLLALVLLAVLMFVFLREMILKKNYGTKDSARKYLVLTGIVLIFFLLNTLL